MTGSEELLIQLLQNLIGNSIKYCKVEHPIIHITAGLEEGGMWQFSMQDNGIGIAEDYHETVFQPFKRLHGTEEYEGTGLGLATCRKIVERHGGRIWLDSKPGEGTTFHFTLPVAPV